MGHSGTHRCSWRGWRVGGHRWGSQGVLAGRRDGRGGPRSQTLRWVQWSLWPSSAPSKARPLSVCGVDVVALHVTGSDGSESLPPARPCTSQSLRPPCACPFQSSEEIFQHLQNIVDFSKNVMKEFLGENSVHCGVSDLCARGRGLCPYADPALVLGAAPVSSFRCFAHSLGFGVQSTWCYCPFLAETHVLRGDLGDPRLHHLPSGRPPAGGELLREVQAGPRALCPWWPVRWLSALSDQAGRGSVKSTMACGPEPSPGQRLSRLHFRGPCPLSQRVEHTSRCVTGNSAACGNRGEGLPGQVGFQWL